MGSALYISEFEKYCGLILVCCTVTNKWIQEFIFVLQEMRFDCSDLLSMDVLAIHFYTLFKNFKWLYSDILSDLVPSHSEVLNFEHFSHQWIGNVLYCFIWCLLQRLILPKSKYHFLPHPWPHKQIPWAFRRGKPLLSYEKTMLSSL